MTRQIGGEHVNVTNMIPTGIDPHDWTYRSQDSFVNMTDAQLFIYNGAGFDDWWVDEMLTSLGARKPAVAVASEGIELITHRHGDVDPHVWLKSGKCAQDRRKYQKRTRRSRSRTCNRL